MSATLIGLGTTACGTDGDLLYMKTSTIQPDDPVYGRLVTVYAASGDRRLSTYLFVRVSGGTLVDPAAPAPVDSLCKQLPVDGHTLREPPILEQRVAVMPSEAEAIVYALLRTDACDGTVRTEIAVPIQRAGDAPAVDGGM